MNRTKTTAAPAVRISVNGKRWKIETVPDRLFVNGEFRNIFIDHNRHRIYITPRTPTASLGMGLAFLLATGTNGDVMPAWGKKYVPVPA